MTNETDQSADEPVHIQDALADLVRSLDYTPPEYQGEGDEPGTTQEEVNDEPTTVERIEALTQEINRLTDEYNLTKNHATLRAIDKLKEQRFWHEEELGLPPEDR